MDAATFWSRVEKTDGCWLWQGAKIPDGYGQAVFDGRQQGAHRIAYQLAVGPIPDGLQLDHLCRNPGCVRPDHLEAVTGRENTLRSPIAPSALNALKTHCPRGHAFARVGKSGRRCVECPKDLDRARRIARGLRVRVTFDGAQIEAICSAVAAGADLARLGAQHGVSAQTIKRIADGRWQRGLGASA